MSNVTYFFDRSKQFRKSIILFKQVGSTCSPVMYMSKPKYLSNEEFDKLFSSMEIKIKGGEQ